MIPSNSVVHRLDSNELIRVVGQERDETGSGDEGRLFWHDFVEDHVEAFVFGDGADFNADALVGTHVD